MEGATKMSVNNRPGFTRRFWRALIRLLAVLAGLALLAAAAAGGYFGFLELQRSFDNVATRMDATDRAVALLRDDVNGIMGEDPEAQARRLTALSGDLESLDARVTTVQADLAEDIEAQQGALEILTAELETADNNRSALTNDVALLNSALTALQGDINANGSRIDELGGEVDTLNDSVVALDTTLLLINEQQAALSTAQSLPPDVQRTLALFRIWELITQARFRMSENNIGSATADIEAADRILNLLVDAEPDNVGLAAVQSRLALAFVRLPEDPETATDHLESAWDELDAIFSDEVFAALDGDVELIEGEVEAVGEEDSTVEPPTATPTPEPTPTPTP
jgi:hypothetical protein